MNSKNTKSNGFTLLEMLVVILIIALLTGIIGPRLLNQVSKSEATAAKAQLAAFDKAIQAYRIDTGRFPPNLQALRSAPADSPRWQGPYLQGDVPKDPWGSEYQYVTPGTNGRDYSVFSYGRDHTAGGSGEDSDIQL
jgi:general secretion pathway protein G